jgi:hypothetical protein
MAPRGSAWRFEIRDEWLVIRGSRLQIRNTHYYRLFYHFLIYFSITFEVYSAHSSDQDAALPGLRGSIRCHCPTVASTTPTSVARR